jgi:hypothetical protein
VVNEASRAIPSLVAGIALKLPLNKSLVLPFIVT